jgi:two-component system chemotaxis response regulator CheB
MSASTGWYEAVVVGASSGGVEALDRLLSGLPADFAPAVAVVQHLPTDSPLGSLPERFRRSCPLPVKEADPGEPVRPGHVYFAPPGYHLLVEKDRTFALDSGARQNYSRPSIDALFTTAADAYGGSLVGVILTGANEDGAEGLRALRGRGGYGIVQDPARASAPQMPAAALAAAGADAVLALGEIAPFLTRLCGKVLQGDE